MRTNLVTLGLILSLTACGDNESNPEQEPEPDGSPVPDASEEDAAAPGDAGPAPARLNTGFGDQGVAILEVLTAARDIHANADGTLLLLGSREARPTVCQLTASGVLDDAWGDGGCVGLGEIGCQAQEVTSVRDVGSLIGSGGDTIVMKMEAIIRTLADGTVDPEFQSPDCAGCRWLDMVSAGADRIVAHVNQSLDMDQAELFILHADGTPDEIAAPGGRFAFPDDGRLVDDFLPGGALAYSNGRIFVLKQPEGVAQQRITGILLD